jgi:hypothetical protein
VIIFNVNQQTKEQDFNFDNRPHHFVDIETGAEVRVHPNKIRDSYQTALKRLPPPVGTEMCPAPHPPGGCRY